MIDIKLLYGRWKETKAEKDGVQIAASVDCNWIFEPSGEAHYIVTSEGGKVASGKYSFDLLTEKNVPTITIDGHPIGRVLVLDEKVLLYETNSRTRYTFTRV